jgi:hypothetical protein
MGANLLADKQVAFACLNPSGVRIQAEAVPVRTVDVVSSRREMPARTRSLDN